MPNYNCIPYNYLKNLLIDLLLHLDHFIVLPLACNNPWALFIFNSHNRTIKLNCFVDYAIIIMLTIECL